MSDLELDGAFDNSGGWQDEKEGQVFAAQILSEKARRKKEKDE